MPSLVDRVFSSARPPPPLAGQVLQIVRNAGSYRFGDDGRQCVEAAPGFGGTLLGHADLAAAAA